MTHLEVAQSIVDNVIPEIGGEVRVSCECGGLEAYATAGDRLTFRDVAEVVDHALNDHISRYSLVLSRSTTLLTGQQLALHSGSPALTAAEENWRKTQQR